MNKSLKAIDIRILAQIKQNDTWKPEGYEFEFDKFGKVKKGNNYKPFHYLDKHYKTKKSFKDDLGISVRAFDKFFKECLKKRLIKWDKPKFER